MLALYTPSRCGSNMKAEWPSSVSGTVTPLLAFWPGRPSNW